MRPLFFCALRRERVFQNRRQLRGAGVFAYDDSRTTGDHPRQLAALLRPIQADDALAPFDGAADFVADAETWRGHFRDEDIGASQPGDVAIVNLAIGEVLARRSQVRVAEVFGQDGAVRAQQFDDLRVDRRSPRPPLIEPAK